MQNIRFVISVAAALSLLPQALPAQVRDTVVHKSPAARSLTDAIESHTGRTPIFTGFVLPNPAIKGIYYSANLTELKLSAQLRDEDEAFAPENGKGASLYSFAVDSYSRLGKGNTAWAGASYLTGKKKSVTWNSTSDYAVIYPYITADSVGGDLNTERYAFYGGYSHSFGRTTAAIGGDFRALHEYRSRNPRPRNISLDLDITAGVSRDIASKYFLALSGNVRIYKQNTSVANYSDRSDAGVAQYLMTGLGTFTPAFFDSNNATMYYQGNGVGASFDLQPLSRRGIFARVSYDRFGFERIASNYSDFPTNDLTRHQSRAEVAYMRPGRFIWGVKAAASYISDLGTDNIPAENTLKDYSQLISLDMYESERLEYSARLIAGYQWQRWTLFAEPYFTYASSDEKHIYPEHQMNIVGFDAGLLLTASHKTPLWRVEGSLEGMRHVNSKGELTMPVANMRPSIVRMMNHRFGRLTDDHTLLSVSVRADRAEVWKGIGILGRISCRHGSYSGGIKGNTLTLDMGITF